MRSLETSVFIDAVAEKTASLRELLLEFRRESLRNTSQHFIRGVQAVVDAVEAFHENRMRHADQNFTNQPSFQDEQKRFYSKLSLQLLAQVHEKYLPLLYSGRQQNEYLVLPSIRRAISLFQADVELSLVPSCEFNYMYDGGMENFVEKTVEILEQYLDAKNKGAVRAVVDSEQKHPRWITFVHFPVVERNSALNLVILAHEIGHLIDQIRQLYKQLTFELEKESYNKSFEEVCGSPMRAKAGGAKTDQLTFEDVFTRAALEPQFRAQCIAVATNWIREVIADLLAIHAVGPSYFFAFSELLAHGAQENRPSESHPAPCFRLNMLLDELSFMGYFSAPGARAEGAEDKSKEQRSDQSRVAALLLASRARVVSELPTTSYKGIMDVSQKTIEKYLDQIRSLVRPSISPYSYTADKYQREVPLVIDALAQGIAPIEAFVNGKFQPNSIPAILNGGWEIYKSDIRSFYARFRDNVPMQERLSNFNQLLFKAIEASEVVRLWQKA